jgi:hypothetical protein
VDAARAAALPPVASLFAAFLGYNPIRTLLGPAIARVPAAKVRYLTGRSFFPKLISGPFHHGLAEAFTFALAACLVAAVASWLRGGKYHHGDEPAASRDAHAADVDAHAVDVDAHAVDVDAHAADVDAHAVAASDA